MTGEMSKADVTREAYPIHFEIADAIGGTVEPFDVYQGPYIATPDGVRLFVCSDDGCNAFIWNEATKAESEPFPTYDELEWAVAAMREVWTP